MRKQNVFVFQWSKQCILAYAPVECSKERRSDFCVMIPLKSIIKEDTIYLFMYKWLHSYLLLTERSEQRKFMLSIFGMDKFANKAEHI